MRERGDRGAKKEGEGRVRGKEGERGESEG